MDEESRARLAEAKAAVAEFIHLSDRVLDERLPRLRSRAGLLPALRPHDRTPRRPPPRRDEDTDPHQVHRHDHE